MEFLGVRPPPWRPIVAWLPKTAESLLMGPPSGGSGGLFPRGWVEKLCPFQGGGMELLGFRPPPVGPHRIPSLS